MGYKGEPEDKLAHFLPPGDERGAADGSFTAVRSMAIEDLINHVEHLKESKVKLRDFGSLF